MILADIAVLTLVCFFFQAEDGIRDLVRSRGLGDVYKRQRLERLLEPKTILQDAGVLHYQKDGQSQTRFFVNAVSYTHLTLPTSDLV